MGWLTRVNASGPVSGSNCSVTYSYILSRTVLFIVADHIIPYCRMEAIDVCLDMFGQYLACLDMFGHGQEVERGRADACDRLARGSQARLKLFPRLLKNIDDIDE